MLIYQKNNIMIRFLLLLLFLPLYSQQEDLLDLLDDEKIKTEYVEASFKGTRVVNAQSLEIPKSKILQFMIQHRFGSIENGFYDLFGTDYASIRYDFHYGYSDKISFGLGRSSLNKIYDIFFKTKLLRQSYGKRKFPLTVVLYNSIGINSQKKSKNDIAVKNNFANRLLFVNQIIIGRKFNRKLSFEVLPTYIHRNLIENEQESHDLFSLGFAGRYKLSNRISLNLDYFLPLGERIKPFNHGAGIGIDYETGGHVFQIMISNSQGPYEYTFIENANGSFNSSTLFLGFNLSRAFTLASDEKDQW